MRKTLGVAALMLALCCPTLAGEIPNPPAPEPQSNSAATASLIQTVLTVIVSVLP